MKEITIDLSTIHRPREICELLKGIKYLTYCFRLKDGTVIKFGKAADSEWVYGSWGNRVYRQAGGISGWVEGELACTSAKKMQVLMQEYFPNVKKDDIIISVFDHTAELEGAEKHVIEDTLLKDEDSRVQQHITDKGCAPKLNIQKTKPGLRGGGARPDPNVLSAFFDFDE